MSLKNRGAYFYGFSCSLALLVSASCQQKEAELQSASWEVVKAHWQGAAEIWCLRVSLFIKIVR